MEMREFTGKSKDDAIRKAIEELGVTKEELQIENVEVHKEGLLGLVGKKTVKIWVVFGNTSAVTQIEDFLAELFSKASLDCRVSSVKETDGHYEVDLTSKDSAVIIGKRGKTLEALQLIANMSVNRILKQAGKVKLVLDIEGYQEKRMNTLRDQAMKVASTVKRTGRAQFMEPMNPYERRHVHITIKPMEGVETISEGDGLIKKIKVVPT